MSETLRSGPTGTDSYMKTPQIDITQSQILLQDKIKQEQELSKEQGNLVKLGVLRGDTNPEHWTGSISLASRLESGELSRDEVDIQLTKLPKFFIEAKVGSPKRCGDGRTITGFDPQSTQWHSRGLGVQIFGGTGGDATGIRLSKGYETDATFIGDIKTTALNHESDFAPGDHTDDHAQGDKTGCGAIDGQERKNDIYLDSERSQTLETILKFVYDKAGLPLPVKIFAQLAQNSQSIKNHADEYFADKHLALNTIEAQSIQGIESLTGQHNEISLTMNFVKGTTFNRDLYNTDTDGKIQNFNIDVWAIIQEHGENASFVLADAIATALDLTDGSIEVFARMPKNTSEDSIKADN